MIRIKKLEYTYTKKKKQDIIQKSLLNFSSNNFFFVCGHVSIDQPRNIISWHSESATNIRKK